MDPQGPNLTASLQRLRSRFREASSTLLAEAQHLGGGGTGSPTQDAQPPAAGTEAADATSEGRHPPRPPPVPPSGMQPRLQSSLAAAVRNLAHVIPPNPPLADVARFETPRREGSAQPSVPQPRGVALEVSSEEDLRKQEQQAERERQQQRRLELYRQRRLQRQQAEAAAGAGAAGGSSGSNGAANAGVPAHAASVTAPAGAVPEPVPAAATARAELPITGGGANAATSGRVAADAGSDAPDVPDKPTYTSLAAKRRRGAATSTPANNGGVNATHEDPTPAGAQDTLAHDVAGAAGDAPSPEPQEPIPAGGPRRAEVLSRMALDKCREMVARFNKRQPRHQRKPLPVTMSALQADFNFFRKIVCVDPSPPARLCPNPTSCSNHTQYVTCRCWLTRCDRWLFAQVRDSEGGRRAASTVEEDDANECQGAEARGHGRCGRSPREYARRQRSCICRRQLLGAAARGSQHARVGAGVEHHQRRRLQASTCPYSQRCCPSQRGGA